VLDVNIDRIAASESELTYPYEQIHTALRTEIELLRSEEPAAGRNRRAEELAWLQPLLDLAAFLPEEEARLVQQATESGVELDGAEGTRAGELRKQIRARKGAEIGWLRGDNPNRWWYEAVEARPIGSGRGLLTTVEVGQGAQAFSFVTFFVLVLSSFAARLLVRVSKGHGTPPLRRRRRAQPRARIAPRLRVQTHAPY
jgi:hypothetical protein